MNIRTQKPVNNKFYQTKAKGGFSLCIKGSPTDPTCDVLANCVGYACGRFNEIIGEMKYPTLYCNAENFIERAKSLGLAISNKPTLGGIMVWQKGETLKSSDGAGHVAIVERIDNDNQIYTSESGYKSSAFWNSIRTNSNGRWGMSDRYKFIGCIINPGVRVENEPTKVEKTIDELAQEVLKGVYGNGEDRKQKLGDKYEAVQNKVNELLNAKSNNEIKVGDRVVPTNLYDYKGFRVHQYDEFYEVSQIDNRGYLLRAIRGDQRPIWAIMPKNNIRKV